MWGTSARLFGVGFALLATAPVWPGLQPGDSIADEMFAPAEVAVVVPLALVFPVAWALLGRTRRRGRLFSRALVLLVLVWASWTAAFGEYGTRPDVDDGLRWYLLTAAAVVVAGVVVERASRLDRRWVSGVVVWVAGIGVTAAVPVVDLPVPPDDALLPLPSAMTVVSNRVTCTEWDCSRRIVVTGDVPARDLVRRLGEHLEHARGWETKWYDFTPEPQFTCRATGWLVDPYELCGSLQVMDELRVEVYFGHANRHDPVF